MLQTEFTAEALKKAAEALHCEIKFLKIGDLNTSNGGRDFSQVFTDQDGDEADVLYSKIVDEYTVYVWQKQVYANTAHKYPPVTPAPQRSTEMTEPTFQTGEHLIFIGDGTGLNCVHDQIGPERIAFDIRQKTGTVFYGRGDSGAMTFRFDNLSEAVWTMAKDPADFRVIATPIPTITLTPTQLSALGTGQEIAVKVDGQQVKIITE